MKKLTFLLVGLIAFTITSCSDEDPNINVLPGEQMTVAPVLEIPTVSDYVVIESIADDLNTSENEEIIGNEELEAGSLTWSAADSEYNGEIRYFIQLTPAGSDFVDSARIFADGVTDLSKSFTFGDINNAMNRLNKLLIANGRPGIQFDEANPIDARIIAVAAISQSTIFSEPVTINITPYEVIIVETPVLFLVGAPQGYYGLSAWTPTTALEMRYIGTAQEIIFEAYVKVASGDGFKFISDQADWGSLSGNYGTIGGAQDGNLQDDGGSGDIKIAETDGDGLYYVQVNLTTEKYKAVKMNWGIIGAATAGGWNDETAMTYDFATNKYSINATLSAGEMKFRSKNAGQFIYNDDWKFNVGVSDPTVTYNGGAGNFSVAGGTLTLGLIVNFDGTAVVSGL
ncbi:SusE domain-containing protein [Flavobacterium sp. SM2513]|uniref:SusE domain-containing protein n=1 Tax=Flavobacterium sp. SM2513 TaxID=3424766 RepID=UPI003D7F8AC1